MDDGAFDELVRNLNTAGPRRAALRALAGVDLGLLAEGGREEAEGHDPRARCRDAGDAAQRRRCLRWARRHNRTHRPPACPPADACGAGCCPADACFVAAVDGDTGEPVGAACCPAAALCRAPGAPERDQCCYPDEACAPGLAGGSVCCRTCPDPEFGPCCPPERECGGGVCALIGTARLPRRRA